MKVIWHVMQKLQGMKVATSQNSKFRSILNTTDTHFPQQKGRREERVKEGRTTQRFSSLREVWI